MTGARTVAVLWRGDEDARRVGLAANERLRPIVEALDDRGMQARPVVHRDEIADATRAALLEVDAVLAWVDPIGHGEDRRCIDALLRDAVTAGVWVSARPDVISRMGTKEVLHRTRHLGWGTDVDRYATPHDLRARFPARLRDGARVLKPRYGNGGVGVWKVELAHQVHPRTGDGDPLVVVHGAERRDTHVEHIALSELLARCTPAFDHGGCVIDQPFQRRVVEGMFRCYLVSGAVVGFARQSAELLLTDPTAAERVMGLPSDKTMLPPDTPELARLRALVEAEWVPGLCRELDLAVEDLPALWDADVLLGEPAGDGTDSYVLCEINCSCVTPFPPEASGRIAAVVAERLAEQQAPRPGRR